MYSDVEKLSHIWKKIIGQRTPYIVGGHNLMCETCAEWWTGFYTRHADIEDMGDWIMLTDNPYACSECEGAEETDRLIERKDVEWEEIYCTFDDIENCQCSYCTTYNKVVMLEEALYESGIYISSIELDIAKQEAMQEYMTEEVIKEIDKDEEKVNV